jgi:hypothetical protein
MSKILIGTFRNFHERQHEVYAHVTEEHCAMVLVKTESGGSVLDLASGNARVLAKQLLEAADRAEGVGVCSLCHQPDRAGGHPECAAKARGGR